MRYPSLLILGALLFAAPLSAQEPAPASAVIPELSEPAVPTAQSLPLTPSLQFAWPSSDGPALAPGIEGDLPFGVEARQGESSAEPAMRQLDRRSWWWTVGAIVTAGLILALLL